MLSTLNAYTGPYISDGRIQSSVEFGQTPPVNALDEQSRLHDSAYAHYKDYGHLRAADVLYDRNVSKLGPLGKTVGTTVLYGNQAMSSIGNISSAGYLGPFSIVYGAVKNSYNLYDFMLNEEKYISDVEKYYATDPGWKKSPSSLPTSDVMNTQVDNEPTVHRNRPNEYYDSLGGDDIGNSSPSIKNHTIYEPSKVHNGLSVYTGSQDKSDDYVQNFYRGDQDMGYPVYYWPGGRRRRKNKHKKRHGQNF